MKPLLTTLAALALLSTGARLAPGVGEAQAQSSRYARDHHRVVRPSAASRAQARRNRVKARRLYHRRYSRQVRRSVRNDRGSGFIRPCRYVQRNGRRVCA